MDSQVVGAVDPADIIAAGFLDCPLPCWVKSWPELNMLIINQAYERFYGIDAGQYQGKTDEDVWDEATSHAFVASDREAHDRNRPVWRHETFINKKTGCWERITAIKWPIKIKNGTVGIAGIAIKREVLEGTSYVPASEDADNAY